MKKKCLGCGKVFEDKISICPDCFAAVENARKDITLEKNLRKEKIVLARRFIFIVWIVVLAVYIYFLTKVSLLLLAKFEMIQNVVFLGLLVVGTLVAYLCGMFAGKSFGKRVFKYWSDKSWYGLTKRQKMRYVKKGAFVDFIMPCLIPLFLWILFHIAIFKLFDLKTTYITIKLSGLSLRGFIIGFMLHFFLSTNWVPRLSK